MDRFVSTFTNKTDVVVADNAGAILAGSSEISTAADDLSKRTKQQATSRSGELPNAEPMRGVVKRGSRHLVRSQRALTGKFSVSIVIGGRRLNNDAVLARVR